MARILAFAGSARKDSYNKRLVRYAAKQAEAKGAEVTFVDLADYPMPIFCQDLEAAEGVPEKARELRKLMMASDGLLISCPEYNSSITPLLKNTIDWTSRPDGDDAGLVAYKGKVVCLLGASDGALGGLRGLFHVRAILGNIFVHIVPTIVAVGKFTDVFDDEKGISNDMSANLLDQALGQLVTMSDRLKG